MIKFLRFKGTILKLLIFSILTSVATSAQNNSFFFLCWGMQVSLAFKPMCSGKINRYRGNSCAIAGRSLRMELAFMLGLVFKSKVNDGQVLRQRWGNEFKID